MKNRTLLSVLATAAIVFGVGPAAAADHSVSIVNTDTAQYGAGKGLNVYSITEKGVKLVKGSPYILPETDGFGRPSIPLTLSINPNHDFVYVAYTSKIFPVVVGFKITAEGLVKQWEQRLETGDPSLQQSYLVAIDRYLVEYLHPSIGYWVRVLTQEGGQQLVADEVNDLVSAHMDKSGKFYYSCRAVAHPDSTDFPADTVVAFDLSKGPVDSSETVPLVTSMDPNFVRSICN
jgi:hypothetical protein